MGKVEKSLPPLRKMKYLIILFHCSSFSSTCLSFGLQRSFNRCDVSSSKRQTTEATKFSTRLYDVPEPLAEEGTWQAFLDDEKTGLIYYFDTTTGESLWEPPTSSFPQVRLPRKKQRIADNLRQEYREARQQMMDNKPESGDEKRKDSEGFFSSVTAMLETEDDIDDEKLDTNSKSDDDGNKNDAEGFFSSVTAMLEVKDDMDDENQEAEQQQVSDMQVRDDEEKLDDDQSSGWFNFLSAGGSEKEVIDDTDIETVEAANKLEWLGGIFGAESSTSSTISEGIINDDDNDNDVQQQDDKKNVLLDSFAAPFARLQLQPTNSEAKKKSGENNIDDITVSTLKIEMGSHVLPHPAKVKWGGEDAIFIKGRTFGVFDGVSGAEKIDGVPLYSRTLANEMKKMVSLNGDTVQDMTAYLATAASYADGAATGASTAIVASIGESGFLQALNVGDSCCIIVRNGKITAKTREISHYWECPYQLSDDSPDQPKDGTKLNVELIPGDVILMGSDGVFDNMSDDLILDVIKSSPLKPTPLAKKICDVSRKVSLDKSSVTPYSRQAKRRGDADFRDGLGGKVDDVSCVAVICK